jgi:hypothetical protein
MHGRLGVGLPVTPLRTDTAPFGDAAEGVEATVPDQPAWQADAEELPGEAVPSRDPAALRRFAGWLSVRPGREADARRAAAAGARGALRELAGWLRHRPGREADAEAIYREAAAIGTRGALHELAGWLRDQPGREAEVEAAYRQAAAAREPGVVRPGRPSHRPMASSTSASATRSTSEGC